jgi:hypothetical protein
LYRQIAENMMQSLLPGLPRIYEPNNVLRLFTGSGMGIAIAAALLPVFNQTVWVNPDPRPAIGGLRSLGVLLVLTVLLDILVLADIPWVLYPGDFSIHNFIIANGNFSSFLS